MENSIQYNNKPLSDAVPILQIENDLIINKDGRVAIGYEMIGSPFEMMKPDNYDSFRAMFDSAINSLPENYIVQKIDIYYNAYYPEGRRPSQFADKGFFERETIKYFSERPVLRQRSYLFIISNTLKNVKNNSASTIFSSGGKRNIKALEGVFKRKTDTEKHGRSFIDSLLSTGDMRANRMQAGELTSLYYQILNLEFREEGTRPYKDILNDKSALIIGEKKVNVVSMQEFPEEIEPFDKNDYGVDAPFMFRLGIYLQFPHITVTCWHREDTPKILSQLDRRRNTTRAFMKVSGQSGEIKAVEIEEFTAHVRASDLKFLGASVSVILYTMSEQARERQIQAVRDAMRKTYNMQPLVEAFDNANSFFACLPGAASDSLRWSMATSDISSCLINPTHEFLSKSQGDYICDRFRNLVYIDLFDRSLNNQNAIVIGPSGSGKSFTMGHFILQRYERQERQVIIDVGGTYKNIFDALGSSDKNSDVKYFEYSPENPISFNPFLTETDNEGKYIFSDDRSNVLLTLFGLIIKEQGENNASGSALGKAEWPVYEQLLSLYYASINEQAFKSRELPNVSNFFKWVVKYRDDNTSNKDLQKNLERIGFSNAVTCFHPFIEGRYKELLNSKEILDISDYRLVCFDMARVKDVKTLYPIVSFLLIELTMDVIRKYPHDKKYFVMDEAWSMLSDSMGSFVEYLYRTIRKNNGSMTIVTQGVTELKGDVGETIKTKCETKIILNHQADEKAIYQVGTALGLTNEEMQKISSIRVTADCREIFIKQGNSSGCFVLEVPSAEHAVLTSQPVERNHLIKLKQIYGSLSAAVKQWEEDKAKGYFENK